MSKKILYFTATWCGPCQKIKPIFKELESKYRDISFCAIDVDLNKQLCSVYNIEKMPTFVFMLGDEEVERFTGPNEQRLREGVANLQNL